MLLLATQRSKLRFFVIVIFKMATQFRPMFLIRSGKTSSIFSTWFFLLLHISKKKKNPNKKEKEATKKTHCCYYSDTPFSFTRSLGSIEVGVCSKLLHFLHERPIKSARAGNCVYAWPTTSRSNKKNRTSHCNLFSFSFSQP